MEPFALVAGATALAGALVVKQIRTQPSLTGVSGVVQFTLTQITQSFILSYKRQVPNTTKTYGSDLQKILAFNQAQKHAITNEQLYEWVALIGAQLQSLSLKISVACTTDFENSKNIRPLLVNSLHKKICQHVQIPRHTREALAITVENCVYALFAVIYKRVKRMYAKRKWKSVWKKITGRVESKMDAVQLPAEQSVAVKVPEDPDVNKH